MKKTIFFLLAFLFVFTSCVEELGPNERGRQTPRAKNKDLVAVTMQLTIPQVELSAGTKAKNMAHTPNIESLHVAVFGLSGYPQAYVKAEPVGSYASTNYNPETPEQNVYEFKVLLPIYEGEAHVHIIANGPESIPFVEQDENSIMSQMQTTGNVGGYWARVVLPEGILPQKDQNGIMDTDDSGNFIPSAETAEAFKNLTLIRNFAEIRLSIGPDAGITNVSWALVNVPQYGSMAPIKKDGNTIAFVDDYKEYTYDTATRKMVHGDAAYDGYMVSDALSGEVTDDMAFPARAEDPLWCYERPDPKKTNPAFILMKADFQGETYYYRIDLNDAVLKDYFPLYRNYVYEIQVLKVGNKGESTPTEAANHNSGGNMSISAETKTLTDVSDGIARLYVEFVEKTYTNTEEKTYQFWAYYVPDITDVNEDGDAIIDNTKLKVSVKTQGTALKAGTAPTINTTLSTDALNVYDFTLNGQSETADLSSVIEVKADNGKTGVNQSILYRDITVRVMKIMDMNLWLDPKRLDEGTDERTVLHINLADTLQESMFPLQFFIEDTNRSLNPTEKDGNTVPVRTGTSIYDPTNKESYYFIRTVQWSEYEPMRNAWVTAKKAGRPTGDIIDFTTEFKPIKPQSATTIYVDNEYFNMKSVDLSNGGIVLSTAQTTVGRNVSYVDVSVQADDEVSWTLTADPGVTLSPDSGEGNGTFRMSFDVNNTFSNRQFTVTAHSGNKGYPIAIIQEGRSFSVSPNTQQINYYGNTATITITADSDLHWTVTPPTGVRVIPASGIGTQTVTVTTPFNYATTAKTYTLTVTPENTASASVSVSITQPRATDNQYTVAYDAFGNFSGTASINTKGNDNNRITVALANCRKQNGTN